MALVAGILGRTGDLSRFANLSGVRAFTGLVPKVDQSGLGDNPKGPTKTGGPGLRQALYMAADHARKVDPTLAERYYRLVVDKGKPHNSALCSVAAVLMSRIAACWRNGTRYELGDTDGKATTKLPSSPLLTQPLDGRQAGFGHHCLKRLRRRVISGTRVARHLAVH